MEEKSIKVVQYLKNLKLDQIEMDTSLAEEYCKKRNNEFRNIPTLDCCKASAKYVTDDHTNKIYYCENSNFRKNTVHIDIELLRLLAEEIEKNAELFAQLEELIRKVDRRDVKQYDIPLLVDQLLWMSENYSEYYRGNLTLDMADNSPLCHLGFAAAVWAQSMNVFILATRNTAAITTLFAELSRKVGFSEDSIQIHFTDAKPLTIEYNLYLKEMKRCYGAAVVTEQTDLDSAVDIIFSATSHYMYPWRLRRVLVQENIYQRFQLALRRIGGTNYGDNVISNIPHKAYSSCIVANQKNILLDFVGRMEDIPDDLSVVLVETYRTTKELLSLVEKYKPQYLSVWCNDMSTANQIAFGTNVLDVWINDYGQFRSPRGVAETYYGGYHLNSVNKDDSPIDGSAKAHMDARIGKLVALRSNWTKKTIGARRSIVTNVLKKVLKMKLKWNLAINDELQTKIASMAECRHRDMNGNCTVSFESGKMCLRIDQSAGLIALFGNIQYVSADKVILMLQSLIDGGALFVCGDVAKLMSLFDLLMAEGVPIFAENDVEYSDKYRSAEKHENVQRIGTIGSFPLCLYKPKSIWSQYGETFAN